MSYESLLRNALSSESVPFVIPEAKFFIGSDGVTFPVLFSSQRATRPFRAYESQSRQNCSLCAASVSKKTSTTVINGGMEWLAANWPIKAYHGICYPTEHRAAILWQDIDRMGGFIDLAGDAVACINVRGSGASVPEHFHAQLHDCFLMTNTGKRSKMTAFPLLDCSSELIGTRGKLALYRVPTYPAFALILQGPWELLGRWLVIYLSASNVRPHNFVLAPGERLFVIPRGLEKASSQENSYGASEMLGLITPVTYEAYDAIQNAEIIIESLHQCGLEDDREQLAVEEHTLWVMDYLRDESTRA